MVRQYGGCYSWFGMETDKKELDTLQMLHDRYADTLSAIDEEIRDSESTLEAMMSELVVEE